MVKHTFKVLTREEIMANRSSAYKFINFNQMNMNKGEEIIGRFNNESKESIDLIKQKAIELVNLIEEHGKDPRRKAAAITDIEKGTMMAVKSLFV